MLFPGIFGILISSSSSSPCTFGIIILRLFHTSSNNSSLFSGMNDRILFNLLLISLSFCCCSAAVRTTKNEEIQKFTIQMIGYSPQKVSFQIIFYLKYDVLRRFWKLNCSYFESMTNKNILLKTILFIPNQNIVSPSFCDHEKNKKHMNMQIIVQSPTDTIHSDTFIS